MKKIRIIIFLIIGMIIGLCISGIGIYASTTYLIDSKNIEYKDNSNLGVTDVQAAIDGTCSNIDTRLTYIETNLNQYNKYTGTNCTVEIYGKIVLITINSTISYSSGSVGVVIAKFPDNIKPKRQMYVPSYASSGSNSNYPIPVLVSFTTTGEIYGKKGDSPNTNPIGLTSFVITYPIELFTIT